VVSSLRKVPSLVLTRVLSVCVRACVPVLNCMSAFESSAYRLHLVGSVLNSFSFASNVDSLGELSFKFKVQSDRISNPDRGEFWLLFFDFVIVTLTLSFRVVFRSGA
jgi:hypothetical protein